MNNRIRTVIATGIIILGGHFLFDFLYELEVEFPKIITTFIVILVAVLVDKFILPRVNSSENKNM